MSTPLIEDRQARATALRKLREVLATLREQADRYRSLPDQAVALPTDAGDGAPTAVRERAVLEAALAFRAGNNIVLPGGMTVEPAGPTPQLLGLLRRLAYLLGLSPLEQEFFTACASDEVTDAWDGRLAYADWLEERGDAAGAARVRKLTPQPGDVLVHYAPPSTSTQEALELHVASARALAETLAARGVETVLAVIPPGGSIDLLPEEQMAAAGWVRAGRVAEEREACAREADCLGSHVAAAAIRERGGDPA